MHSEPLTRRCLSQLSWGGGAFWCGRASCGLLTTLFILQTFKALQPQSSLPDQNGKPRPESDRLIVYRQECQKLRKELKLVTSALAKELGDDVPVSRVLVRLCNCWK